MGKDHIFVPSKIQLGVFETVVITLKWGLGQRTNKYHDFGAF